MAVVEKKKKNTDNYAPRDVSTDVQFSLLILIPCNLTIGDVANRTHITPCLHLCDPLPVTSSPSFFSPPPGGYRTCS